MPSEGHKATGRPRGRPRGTPCSPERKEQARQQMLAKWADPAFRAERSAILRAVAPIGHAASLKVTRAPGYSDYMREVAKRHPNRLPEMSPEDRWFYFKLKRGNRYSRAEALALVFAP